MSAASRGAQAERERAAFLRSYGWQVDKARLSKGAWDLEARHPIHGLHYESVKMVANPQHVRQAKHSAKKRFLEAMEGTAERMEPGAVLLISIKVLRKGWKVWEMEPLPDNNWALKPAPRWTDGEGE